MLLKLHILLDWPSPFSVREANLHGIIFTPNTVELQWLENLWDQEN